MASILAHELEETVTDPLGTAWYDSQGAENGDKCAWTFGSPTPANQSINGHDYYLQREWSNASSACVLAGL